MQFYITNIMQFYIAFGNYQMLPENFNSRKIDRHSLYCLYHINFNKMRQFDQNIF